MWAKDSWKVQKSLVWTQNFTTFLSESDRRLQWWTGREFQPTFQDTSLLLFSNLKLQLELAFLDLGLFGARTGRIWNIKFVQLLIVKLSQAQFFVHNTYTLAVVFSFPHTGAPEQEYRQRHKKKDRCRVYSYPTPLYVPVQLYSYPTPLYVSMPLYSYPTLHHSAALSIYKLECILIQPLTSKYQCTMFPL